jgi:DUF971 family protein
MTSASKTSVPVPTALTLRTQSQLLEVEFPDGVAGALSAEFLRTHSPSAEVTGHSAGEGILVVGKEHVRIERIEPVGRYAVRLVFDDGHDTGLFTWRVLYDLCKEHDVKWQRYLERLVAAGQARTKPS